MFSLMFTDIPRRYRSFGSTIAIKWKLQPRGTRIFLFPSAYKSCVYTILLSSEQNHQFFSAQLSLWSNSPMHTWWLLGKLSFDIWTFVGKVMLKILQARLQQYENRELPDVQAGFRKGRGTRDQIANIRWIMEKQTGSKLGKEYVKAVYCHPAYLTYIQSTSWERLGWKNAMTGEPRGISRVVAGFSSYNGEFRLPLVLAQDVYSRVRHDWVTNTHTHTHTHTRTHCV